MAWKGDYGAWGKGGGEREAEPSDNLYVWQLPQEADETFLEDLFKQVGNVVSCKVVPGKRYGFVRYGSIEEATAAVGALNGLECHNTVIKVKFADKQPGTGKGKGAFLPPQTPQVVAPPPHAPGQGGAPLTGGAAQGPWHGGGGGEESQAAPSNNLYAWQLPQDCDDQFLRELFEQVGAVTSVKCVTDKRYGFIRFETTEQATIAIQEIDGLSCNGTTIKVKFADASKKGGGKGKDQAHGQWQGQPAYSSGAHVVEPPASLHQTGARLFVEDLPTSLSSQDIGSIFDQYSSGAQCEVLKGTSSELIAMITVGTYEEAQWIVENLNGNIPQGLNSPLRISMAQWPAAPPRNVPSPYGKSSGKASPKGAYHQRASPYANPHSAGVHAAPENDPNNTNVYAYQLPNGCDDDRLRQMFQECGTILSVKCMTDKRFGFVKFGSVEEAQNAITLVNGSFIDDTTVKCQFANRNKQ